MDKSHEEDDEARRRREISMFASFALGGEEPIAGFDNGEYSGKSRASSVDERTEDKDDKTKDTALGENLKRLYNSPSRSSRNEIQSSNVSMNEAIHSTQVPKDPTGAIFPRALPKRMQQFTNYTSLKKKGGDDEGSNVASPKQTDRLTVSPKSGPRNYSPSQLSPKNFAPRLDRRSPRRTTQDDDVVGTSTSKPPFIRPPNLTTIMTGSPSGIFGKSSAPPVSPMSNFNLSDGAATLGKKQEQVNVEAQAKVEIASPSHKLGSPISSRLIATAASPRRADSQIKAYSVPSSPEYITDPLHSNLSYSSRKKRASNISQTQNRSNDENHDFQPTSAGLPKSPKHPQSTLKTTIDPYDTTGSDGMTMSPSKPATPTQRFFEERTIIHTLSGSPGTEAPPHGLWMPNVPKTIDPTESEITQSPKPVLSMDDSRDAFLKALNATNSDIDHGSADDDGREMFLKAANVEAADSGTFAFDSSTMVQKPGMAEQANLAAAVAALEKTDLHQRPANHNDNTSNRRTSRHSTKLPPPLVQQEQTIRKTEDICMFAEEVVMPRPLFFGAVVPPRVLHEARTMVKTAILRYEDELKQLESFSSPPSSPTNKSSSSIRVPPRLYELPTEVRNVVGALRTYGYGLVEEAIQDLEAKPESVKPVISTASLLATEKQVESKWRGNPYVSTFQPVWDNDVRVQRVKNYKKQLKKLKQLQRRPKPITRMRRSSTAPARLLPLMFSGEYEEDADDVDDDDDSIFDQYPVDGQISSPLHSSTSKQSCISEQDKGDEHRTNRGQEKGTQSNAKNSIAMLSPNELFTMWLRNDDDSYMGTMSTESVSSHRSIDPTPPSSSPRASLAKPSVQSAVKSSMTNPVNDGTQQTTIGRPCTNDTNQIGVENSSDNSDKDTPSLVGKSLFSKWAGGTETQSSIQPENISTGSVTFAGNKTGGSDADSIEAFRAAANASASFNPRNTFQRMPLHNNDGDSDDGSVIDDEQKKQVGVNDHLSKAIALLEDDGQPSTNDVTTLEQSQVLLAANDGTRKRPLTNYELSTGCCPLFGVDDSPLPQEADLGIHETKEEQQRAQEQKRSQEIIEKFVAPNVFGPVACPNPGTGPDDFHSWMSRSVTSSPSLRLAIPNNTVDVPSAGESGNKRQYNSYGSSPSTFDPMTTPPMARDCGRSRSEGNSVDMGLNLPLTHRQHTTHHQQYTYRQYPRPPKHTGKRSGDTGVSPPTVNLKSGKRLQVQTRSRFGWWSPVDDSNNEEDDAGPEGDDNIDDNILQIPPIQHSASGVQVWTALEPTPEQLRTDNLPLSRMHAATSMEQSLPYLSDRPHSYRYLQIDTQAIAFPPVSGEIEPLFCSLAIYNVEAMSTIGSTQSSGERAPGTSTATKQKTAPLPNMHRCGRVTEALYFDHVSDDDVARRCEGSLYPYLKINSEGEKCNEADNATNFAIDGSSEKQMSSKSQSTRCGVFPIPSNMNVTNLYAVLIVRKVISEEVDLNPYIKSSSGSKTNTADLEKLRSNAEKNSNHHGCFLMPFAFGVAPLLQVFGTDNPCVPSSRAVQIPLFRFTDKESQIIDHIMRDLRLGRANHKANGVGGPAPVTNGGTAMLVMRNFGYLGLHPVIDCKSSLARDRLVDFTGEVQVRRKTEVERDENPSRTEPEQSEGYKIILPDFHPEYIAEPTENGGRFVEEAPSSALELGTTKSYAQELLPLPLQISPSLLISSGITSGLGRGQTNQDDMEPFYHTSFCNELLCHPRILHNCPKGNVVVKVELREVEWVEEHSCYVAHLPSSGPSVHNTRRGPFLVQSAFSSCTSRRSHQFMDEFKLKLPLDLKPRNREGGTRILSIFFSLFKIKLSSSKSRWKRGAKFLFGAGTGSENFDAEENGVSGNTRIHQISCGFLPLTDRSCLIDNGVHDVRIVYKSSPLPDSMVANGFGTSSTYILKEHQDDATLPTVQPGKDDSYAEDTTVSDTSLMSDNQVSADTKRNEEVQSNETKGKSDSNEPMSLSVRIVVFSSLHCQNSTLSDFLNQETDIPVLSQLPNKVFMSTLRMGRSYLVNNTSLESSHNKFHTLDEQLMETTIAITDHQLCSVSRSAGHIIRIIARLWRSLICGNGEPSLAWSNPGTATPLRIHSFATIVHLVGATSLYLAKHGVTQLDGTRKWNVVTFGRVLALLFNEGALFGSQAEEKFDEEFWSTPEALNPSPLKQKSPVKQSLPKRKRHFRNNYDLFNDLPPRETPTSHQNEVLSSTAGDLATPPQKRNVLNVASLSSTEEAGGASHQVAPKSTQWFDPKLDFSQASRAANPSMEGETSVPERERKVDSKIDFQQAFRAANADTDGEVLKSDRQGSSSGKLSTGTIENASNQSSRNTGSSNKAFIQAFGDVAGNNRRWMTVPTKILLTIPESENDDDVDNDANVAENDMLAASLADVELSSSNLPVPIDDNDTLDVVKGVAKQTKQMRRPRIPLKQAEVVVATNAVEHDLSATPLLLTSDDDIETKGTAFLDSIGESIGMSFSLSNGNGEEQRVGSSHHRSKKNHNRSSIDWSLMSDNLTTITQPPIQEEIIVVEETEEEEENIETMATLKNENYCYVKLPNFIDRLLLIGKFSAENSRWFPYAYEVIIMQWAAILMEQRKSGDKTPAERPTQPVSSNSTGPVNRDLSQAALRSVGVAVASTPMLFEVIKQSLAFRVQTLFTQILTKKTKCQTPPLVMLDETLADNLEHVITMVTDACIDSRNFDSWDLRQMSIDVNDALIRFLRDLFSFVVPSYVHRLILAYFARFVTRDGKQVHDRDSKIGLRCSWEITKLRLSAVTALIRFPEFIKINSPQMLNWTNWWMTSPTRSTSKFYDNVLDRYQALRLPSFVGIEDSNVKGIEIPKMRPHWLAEIISDICLLGTEHAEQYIQHRSASLLHELFWSCSQESILAGTSAPVASMFITFIEKVVSNANYLANFSAKSQLRKDILLCVIFVLQSAPKNLLRALWRQLIARMPGRDLERKYFGEQTTSETVTENSESQAKLPNEMREEPNILGMFSLLNLALRTIEYEGCDDHVEADGAGENRDSLEGWHREYLLCRKRRKSKDGKESRKSDDDNSDGQECTSSTSRKWQAHDGSIVIVNSGHHIVRELYGILRTLPNGKHLLNPAVQHGKQTIDRSAAESSIKTKNFRITKGETILFVRAVTSLYLHALALRESDIVLVRTFLFSAEVIKMFGISIFLEAVGETLQHWMRVISFNCGARRAQVRIEATDLLELILRSSWECFGSFFRIRVPLLAVQTEVMERIVALAASRYYREQRKTQASVEAFSNLGAEASLVPLWRTLDRIQKQPASQNIAFRGALIRIAGKLKKLYRAYVAARVLSFIKGAKDKELADESDERRDFESEAIIRANRINLIRVINASAGHSKQFLGFQGTAHQPSSVAHFEAVEDALIDAADVFSPTELPEHRVAWLRMLAEFHSGRKKYAEEGTCHYHIHVTLHLAAKLHGALWSNTPFLPWTDNIPDPVVYIDGDATQTEPDCTSELFYESNDWEYGKRMDTANSFRRIFYRVANSIAIENSGWDSGVSKNLFYGITFADEYSNVSPWITLREVEENMAEELEAAGHLFLKAGIIESSRFAWNLAAQLYAEKFNYAKLTNAYNNLAKAVVSQVPPIDTSLPQEILATLGRFYRVWFHGGAPDDLSGVEFVYRTQGDVPLKQFGDELRDVIKSIIPDKTPIHLVLDGLSEEKVEEGATGYTGFSRIGPAPLEPVRIKVTPLRPIFETKMRGLPEWFNDYVDETYNGPSHRSKSDVSRGNRGRKESNQRNAGDPHHHDHFRSFSATIFSSAGSATTTLTGRRGPISSIGSPDRAIRLTVANDSNLRGVDKFCFLQPRDRSKGSKEWWKTGDFAEKCLKITQLQVSQSFPACVARQTVVHRLVYTQSPLEAGIDAVCQWCAILFRTSVSTAGTVVLKTNYEPGIGTEAARVVSECIHGSRIKEIGLALLKKESDLVEGEQSTDFTLDYGRLSEDEVKKLQKKLSRLIIVFIELLHLLITRNRDLLLNVIKKRKKSSEFVGNIAMGNASNAIRPFTRASSGGVRPDGLQKNPSTHKRSSTDGNQSDNGIRSEARSTHNNNNMFTSDDQQSYQSVFTAAGVRTDSAIAVQSELQRSFIKIVKDLYPRLQGILQSETPRWLKQCTNDNYFSLGSYQQTKVVIAEELCFIAPIDPARSDSNNSRQRSDSHLSQSDNGYDSPRGSIGGASQSSAISRGSDNYGMNQF